MGDVASHSLSHSHTHTQTHTHLHHTPLRTHTHTPCRAQHPLPGLWHRHTLIIHHSSPPPTHRQHTHAHPHTHEHTRAHTSTQAHTATDHTSHALTDHASTHQKRLCCCPYLPPSRFSFFLVLFSRSFLSLLLPTLKFVAAMCTADCRPVCGAAGVK